MPQVPEHIGWLVDTGERLKTADGKDVEVWEFQHHDDEEVLSAWAKHFRNHYCFDSEIDYWRRGYKCSRSEYLNSIKFPDPKAAPGPSIRAGDFGEVLVADFLEYLNGYWVPRTRYGDKTIRNESRKGSDIIGFHIVNVGKASSRDKLAIFEAKAQFSGKKPTARLQDAVDGSAFEALARFEELDHFSGSVGLPEESRPILGREWRTSSSDLGKQCHGMTCAYNALSCFGEDRSHDTLRHDQ